MKTIQQLLLTFSLCLAHMLAYALDNDSALQEKLLADTQWLPDNVLDKALRAYTRAKDKGQTDSPIFTVIDYSKPSNEPRLWVFDLQAQSVLYEDLVSHGRGSGNVFATEFSNIHESYQSSLGLFKTDVSYWGRNGYSLRLDGLEPGINDQARARAIVIHGADYVHPDFINKHGRLGRSHGCPAVPHAINQALIDTIKDGSLVFIYYPDEIWLAQSAFL